MKLDKKAAMSIIVVMILMLVGSSILYGVTSQILRIFGADSDEQLCTLTTVFSSATKIQGVDNLKINCPLRLHTITEDEVRRATVDVIKSARETAGKSEDSKAEKFDRINKDFMDTINSKEGYDDVPNYNGMDALLTDAARTHPLTKEFALSSLMGEEMRKCWKKMGEGDLDLFSNWLSEESDLWKQLLGITGFKNKPSLCVVCSRIKFDKNVENDLGNKAILSLPYWSKLKNVKHKSVTYYEYLMDEVHNDELFKPVWQYSASEPQAIVFARVPASQLGIWGSNLKTVMQQAANVAAELIADYSIYKVQKGEDKAKDMLYLVPYENVGDVCGHMLNDAPTYVKEQ